MENETDLEIEFRKAKTVTKRTVDFTVLGADPLPDTPRKVYRQTLRVRTDTEEFSHSTTVEEGVWYRKDTGERLPGEVGVRLEAAYQRAD